MLISSKDSSLNAFNDVCSVFEREFLFFECVVGKFFGFVYVGVCICEYGCVSVKELNLDKHFFFEEKKERYLRFGVGVELLGKLQNERGCFCLMMCFGVKLHAKGGL